MFLVNQQDATNKLKIIPGKKRSVVDDVNMQMSRAWRERSSAPIRMHNSSLPKIVPSIFLFFSSPEVFLHRLKQPSPPPFCHCRCSNFTLHHSSDSPVEIVCSCRSECLSCLRTIFAVSLVIVFCLYSPIFSTRMAQLIC